MCPAFAKQKSGVAANSFRARQSEEKGVDGTPESDRQFQQFRRVNPRDSFLVFLSLLGADQEPFSDLLERGPVLDPLGPDPIPEVLVELGF